MSTLRVSRVKTLDDVVWVVFLCCGVCVCVCVCVCVSRRRTRLRESPQPARDLAAPYSSLFAAFGDGYSCVIRETTSAGCPWFTSRVSVSIYMYMCMHMYLSIAPQCATAVYGTLE